MTNYIVDFVNSASQAEIDAYLSENNCILVNMFDNLNRACLVSSETLPPGATIVTHVLDDTASSINLLTAIPVIQDTVPPTVEILNSDAINWWKVYSLKGVDLSAEVTTAPKFGQYVNVYVVDSGIDISHPEFAGKDIDLLYSLTGDFSDNTGHGTALSSLVVGSVCGLTNATLKVVKIFDSVVATKQSDLLYAFDAILNDANSSVNKVSVVNLSWSIAKNIYIEEKIRHLIQAGIVVVVAAGNSGLPIADVTPASMSDVLTIGSYDLDFTPSNFSNYTGGSATSVTAEPVNHGAIDSWAPGEQIWAATIGGGYNFVAGTSAATAIYAAAVAYNASQRLTESSDLIMARRNSDGVVILSVLTNKDRTGLLDFSDPKYAASTNKICTYINVRNAATTQPSTLPFKAVVDVGGLATPLLFATALTASYEILTQLPSYMTVQRNMLCIHPTEEPISPSGVDIIDVPFRVTSLDNTQFESTVTVVVRGSTFDVSLLPPDDPLIEITLLVACQGDRYLCVGKTCPGSSGCVTVAKSFCECSI
jgi:hypothetical protein